MLIGNINEVTKELRVNFVRIDESEFEEIELNISEMLSSEELIEKINEMYFESIKYVKIILVGNRKMEIEPLKILKYLTNPNIIKIKDKTTLEVDLQKLSEQNSLKGLFVKTLLEKAKDEPENREKIERAIEIGLEAF
ncbi:MAG: hypothetical protein HFJ50_02925 [Clostridia bacterium]|jgi:hypothetical protein|nr:hypothetical protein [Clostridia bacterium]